MSEILYAETPAAIAHCHPVMVQLRPQYDLAKFVAQVLRQHRDGYRLVYVEDQGVAKSAAGYRFGENLAWGRFLYVDDLVTLEAERSKGHGERLFDWLVAKARSDGCDQFHLDSGVQRFAAHRFYLRKRMDITSHHFVLRLLK